MKNEEILKENNVKRFSVILMNPPYGVSGDNTLHLKFSDKCLDISETEIVIMPFTFIIQPANQNIKNYKENFSKRLIEVEEIPSSVFEDVNGLFDVGIYEFRKTSNGINIKFKDGKNKIVNHLNKVNKFTDYEESFIKYLDNDGNIDAAWGGGHNHCTVTSLARKCITNEKEVWKIIDKDIENNCKKLKEGKVFLQLSENGYGKNGVFFEKHTGNIFKTKDELIKHMQEHGRKSTRGFNFIMFDSVKAAENCKDALYRPLMRFCLYKTQYTKLIGIKNNYKYIPKIDWSDDRVKTDEGLLEVCGCPKYKCKEYAEYCKKIINEVDKK